MKSFSLSRLKILWNIAFLVVSGLFLFSFFQKGGLPALSEMVPEVFQEPLQTATDRADFSFLYRGKTYFVHPLYTYDITAVVMSHNSIGGFGDIYHTEDSVDLKDICVMYGDNVKSSAYLRSSVENTSFFCWWKYPAGVTVSPREISNNHLLAADPALQEKIRNIHPGDEVHITGLLVSYTYDEWNGHFRTSSTTRDDTGGGACEVLFVDHLEILRASTPFLFFLFEISKILLVILLVLRVLLWWYGTKKAQEEWDKKARTLS